MGLREFKLLPASPLTAPLDCSGLASQPAADADQDFLSLRQMGLSLNHRGGNRAAIGEKLMMTNPIQASVLWLTEQATLINTNHSILSLHTHTQRLFGIFNDVLQNISWQFHIAFSKTREKIGSSCKRDSVLNGLLAWQLFAFRG